jgi:hypothetical protein
LIPSPAASQRIGAVESEQHVRTVVAGQIVIAGIASEQVRAGAPVKHVVSRAAAKLVAARTAEHRVFAVSAIKSDADARKLVGQLRENSIVAATAVNEYRADGSRVHPAGCFTVDDRAQPAKPIRIRFDDNRIVGSGEIQVAATCQILPASAADIIRRGSRSAISHAWRRLQILLISTLGVVVPL